ncbi:helix-turn-helix domain-containing protein [Kitasatospora sp. NPDC059827]|uniref:helix-turn-helix domain-containing protein n=1 Tax=Kitasatospora sp. NPDC059827 TaxID=3346964 RepID=UPI0036524D97
MGQEDDVAEFLDRLRQLRALAGNPSFRTMSRTSGIVSHSALHEAIAGRRLPTWPVVREFVKACGGDEAEWRRAWAAAANPARGPGRLPPDAAHEADHPVEQPAGPAGPAEALGATSSPRPAPVPRRRWFGRRGGVASHGAALLAGIVIGAVTGYVVGSPASAQREVTAAQQCQDAISDDGVQQPLAAHGQRALDAADPAPAGQSPGAPAWVGRPGAEAHILTGTSAAVPITQNVAAGDALVVSIMLTSTCPAPLTVTDSRGSRYQLVADVFDTRHHRVAILAAFDVAALSTADHLAVTYVTASKYHVVVDEYRDIHSVAARATGLGESGGTSFGITGPTCRAGQLLVGAVGSNSGTGPLFEPGWADLPTVKLSSYWLTTGYRLVRTPGPCSLAGATTAQWGAVLAVLQ